MRHIGKALFVAFVFSMALFIAMIIVSAFGVGATS